MIYGILLLALFASCESTDAPLVRYESPHGLVVLKAARVDFAAEGEDAAAARAHFAAGESYLDEGRCSTAAASYLQAAARRPSPAVWLNAGVALLCDGEYGKAGEVLAKGLEPSATRAGVRAALLGNLGQAHQRLGRLDSALVCYQDAVELHRQNGFAAGEAQALGDLGAAYFMQGDPEQALSFLKQARDGHRRIGDQLGLARDLDRIGTIYFVRGAADSARLAFAEALELYRDEEYLRGQAGGLTNIGNIHLDEGRLDSAHFYFSAGLAILERLADDAARAIQLARIGQIYQRQDDLEAALVAYREALAIHQAQEKTEAQAETHDRMARIFFQQAVWIRHCLRTKRRSRSIGGMIATRASGRRHWTTLAMCICIRVVWIRHCLPLKRRWRFTSPTAIRAAGPFSRARSAKCCKSRGGWMRR